MPRENKDNDNAYNIDDLIVCTGKMLADQYVPEIQNEVRNSEMPEILHSTTIEVRVLERTIKRLKKIEDVVTKNNIDKAIKDGKSRLEAVKNTKPHKSVRKRPRVSLQ